MTDARSDRTNGLLLVGAMVALMWLLEVVDVIVNHRLDAYGIEPRGRVLTRWERRATAGPLLAEGRWTPASRPARPVSLAVG